jgi:DNA-directed RNA polymerase subunit RPC12/RpoP
MNSTPLEDLTIPVACPHCGYKVRKRISVLSHPNAIHCSSCNRPFHVDQEQFGREVARVEKALTTFVRRLTMRAA